MGLADRVEDAFAGDGPLARAAPGYRRRDGQVRLAQAVAEAIEAGGVVVAEAATGIGKTFAYLVPALLAGRAVVVSTGTRQLQDQLYEKDLARLKRSLGLSFRAAILKGRANYVCPYHLERNLADGRFGDPELPGKLRIISAFAAVDPIGDKAACSALTEEDPAWALATSTRDNCLGPECPRIGDCPLARARQQAQRADVLVVNHHLYCADLALKDGAFGDFLPEAAVTIFDEAHLLPEIAADFFGEAVSTRQLQILARDISRAARLDAPDQREWPRLAAEIEGASRHLRACLPGGSGRWGDEQLQAWRSDDPALWRAFEAVPEILARAARDLAAVGERSPDLQRCADRAGDLALTSRRWLERIAVGEEAARADAAPTNAAGSDATGSGATGSDAPDDAVDDEAAILWLQVSSQHAALRMTPLSVAGRLARDRREREGCRVYLSATLAVNGELSHFGRAIGLDRAGGATVAELVVASPFDYPGRAALWLPQGLGAAGGPGFAGRLVEAIWPLIDANRGRAFVLCTTLRAVAEIGRLLRLRAGRGLEVLCQGEGARQQLLERFRAAEAAVLVGAASFWQGVDVPGDGLSLVVIDKIPFAPPDDPVFAARSRAVERAGGKGFEALSLPQAALTLKQGAGRLIRTERDRGVLVIGDERLRTRSYGRRLLQSLPPFTRVGSGEQARSYLPVDEAAEADEAAAGTTGVAGAAVDGPEAGEASADGVGDCEVGTPLVGAAGAGRAAR